jgi:hypothetical protein
MTPEQLKLHEIEDFLRSQIHSRRQNIYYDGSMEDSCNLGVIEGYETILEFFFSEEKT